MCVYTGVWGVCISLRFAKEKAGQSNSLLRVKLYDVTIVTASRARAPRALGATQPRPLPQTAPPLLPPETDSLRPRIPSRQSPSSFPWPWTARAPVLKARGRASGFAPA